MIVGTGVDLMDIARFSVAFSRHEKAFLTRIFTPRETEHAMQYKQQRRLCFFAGRFAAKEAISKAFGCGFGSKLKWVDLEILPDSNGKPILTHNEALQALCDGFCHISITHEKAYVMGYAILESACCK